MAACAPTLFGSPREWAWRLTVGAALGVFLGLIGPFGTFDRALPVRVAEWTLTSMLGGALFVLAVRLARRAGRRLNLPAWFAVGAAIAAACVPFSVAVGLLFSRRYLLEGGWPAALEFYGDCLLVSAPLAIGSVYLSDRLQGPHSAAAAPRAVTPAVETPSDSIASPAPGPTAANWLDRLPPRLGRDLTALQMEDHYVRAHTPLGSDLLLIPMGQAVEALGGLEGLRVHRSWWVARGAVRGQAWDGRNLRLLLAGGLEAPVARAQVAALRAAGLARRRARRARRRRRPLTPTLATRRQIRRRSPCFFTLTKFKDSARDSAGGERFASHA